MRFAALVIGLLLSGSVVPPPPASVPTPQGAPEAEVDLRSADIRLSSRPVAPVAAPALPSASEGAIGTVLLGGFATWYKTPGLTAAAGPLLRDVLGDWRGQLVEVESGSRSVTVQLTDWCACGSRQGVPTLLDLSDGAFAELAPLSAGVVRVSIEIGPAPDPRDDAMRREDGGPGPTLPPTDSTEGSTP